MMTKKLFIHIYTGATLHCHKLAAVVVVVVVVVTVVGSNTNGH